MMNLNFEVKIVEYKLTDLKKEAQDAILELNPYSSKVYSAEHYASPLWNDLVDAGWVWVNGLGYYELTDDGKKLIREHNRRKLKRRWFKRG